MFSSFLQYNELAKRKFSLGRMDFNLMYVHLHVVLCNRLSDLTLDNMQGDLSLAFEGNRVGNVLVLRMGI
jgi:hypothetical protein